MSTNLPTIPAIELDGYTLDVGSFLAKEYLEIGEASIELPTVIEWLNLQLQSMIESKHKLKADLGRVEATAFFALKQGKFQQLGYGDKPTETAVAHAVNLDPDVARISDDLAVVTGWVERLTNLQRSLQHKLELVRSVEATRRTVAGVT